MRKCGDGQRAAPRRRRHVEGKQGGRSSLLAAASASCAGRGDGLGALSSESRRAQSARTAVAPRQSRRAASRSGQLSRYAVAAAHRASGGGSRGATPSSLHCAKVARTGVTHRQSRCAASKPRQPPHRAVAAELRQNRRDSRRLLSRCAKAAALRRANAARIAVTSHRYRRYVKAAGTGVAPRRRRRATAKPPGKPSRCAVAAPPQTAGTAVAPCR